MSDDEYKIYALFNNKTKQLVCFLTDLEQFPESIKNTLLIKEFKLKDLGFSSDEINLTRFKWEGDFDNGRLVDIVKEKKAIVTEKEIDERYHHMFWSRYSVQEVLMELILNMHPSRQEGYILKNFLEKTLTKKQEDITFYKNSDVHIWESNDEIKKREKDAFR